MKRKIVATALLATSFVLQAQENESTVGEVTVTGKFLQIPYKNSNGNVAVILKKDIENSSSKSIEELLQNVTGMDIRRRGANGVQSDITIRGGNFEQALIMINGIRMNDSQTGHNSMNIPVDLSNVERIEIIKGAAARRFGNNAYGGVINIVTKASGEELAKISAEAGDFSTYHLGLQTTFGNEKIAHLFSANTASSDGYRHNTDYTSNNYFYQNNISIRNGKISFQAGFSDKKFGANGFYSSPAATEQYEETQASVVSAAHRQNFGNFSLNSNLYWRRGQDMYLFNRTKPEIYRNMHIGNNVGGEINGNYDWVLGNTGVGVEVRKEFLASNNLGERDRFLTQIFFEHQFSLLQNKLQISPGISWANYSNAGNFFYPGIDAGFNFNSHHKIYANLAKVHRIPTFTDLYYVSRTEAGNPNLKPESAVSYELGYRFLKENLQVKLSHFGRNTNDAIDWTKESETDIWRAENIGSIDTKGFEAEISDSFFDNHLNLSAGYTYLDNKIKEERNFSRYALDNLKHQFTAKMNTNFGNFSHEIAYRYNERVNLGSFNVIDTKLNYRFKDLNIYTTVTNITNSKYSETFGVPMPGRWFHLGVNYQIKY